MRTDRSSLWLDRAPRPPSGSAVHVLPSTTDVLVVGGGLTGLCTAVLLARRGVDVVVLDAHRIGDGTTGRSTAKLSLLQGSVLSRMRRHAGRETVAAYVSGNLIGQSWLLETLDSAGVPVNRRDAVTYAVTEEGAKKVHAEAEACSEAGLDVSPFDPQRLVFRTTAAITMSDQAQFDPVQVLDHLHSELLAMGVPVVEHARAEDMSWRRPWTVSTTAGEIVASRVVLATQTPVLDRTLHFTGLRAQRSYAIAYRLPEDGGGAPREMCLSVDAETRSLRTAGDAEGEVLVVGGGDHEVGREPSPRRRVAELDSWARAHFTIGEALASWSAQDYAPVTAVPSVGVVPGTGDSLYVATGFSKWGMASAPMAAHAIAGSMTGEEPAWAPGLRRHVPGLRDVAQAASFSVSVGTRLMGDRVVRARRAAPAPVAPPEGAGRVEGGPVRPTAVSTVGGRTCRVSAVCPHLGGILAWNDVEDSWDCPLHGSRFSADGTLLEGPATSDLGRVDQRTPGRAR